MPKGSLKFFYGPDDDSDSKGGFTAVSVGTNTMTVTFYNYKGIVLYTHQPLIVYTIPLPNLGRIGDMHY